MPKFVMHLLMSCCLISTWSWADDLPTHLSLAAGSDIPLHDVASAVLIEAYGQLNITAEVHSMPPRRSMMEANEGRMDGDVGRILGTEQTYPNLIRVPVPVASFRSFAFGTREDLDIHEWSDLQGLRIGIVRGVRYAELGTEGMNPEMFDSYTDALKVLNAERLDVVIGSYEQTMMLINQHFPKSGIKPLGTEIFRSDLFHFLNKKHETLVAPLAEVLQDMANRGRQTDIYDEFFGKL